jgi:hypothetical protein
MISVPFISLRYVRENDGSYHLVEDLFSEGKGIIPQVLKVAKPFRPDYKQRYEYVVEGEYFISGLVTTNLRTVFMGDVRIESESETLKRMILFCFSSNKTALTIRFYPNHKPSKKLAEGEAVKTLN